MFGQVQCICEAALSAAKFSCTWKKNSELHLSNVVVCWQRGSAGKDLADLGKYKFGFQNDLNQEVILKLLEVLCTKH